MTIARDFNFLIFNKHLLEQFEVTLTQQLFEYFLSIVVSVLLYMQWRMVHTRILFETTRTRQAGLGLVQRKVPLYGTTVVPLSALIVAPH